MTKCCYCGGGVLVYGDTSETGKLTIKEGAEISDNWANHTDSNSSEIGGGGIYNRGIVIMEGGEIKNNKSSYTAGGVFNRGQFDMSGGTISGNSLTNNNSGSTDGLYIYNNTAMAVCSISLSGSASIPKNNVSPQNGIYLYGNPIPVINLKGPLSNSNFYLLNAPTGNVIYNQAEMDRSDFVTQVAKFSLSSGSLTVDEEGTYAVKQ